MGFFFLFHRLYIVRWHHWCHSIGLFEDNPDPQPWRTNRSARKSIWSYRFKVRVSKLSIPKLGCRVDLSFPLLCEVNPTNDFWQDLIQNSAFSSFFLVINPCFATGKHIWVWNCHATLGHWETFIVTCIVYVFIQLRTPKKQATWVPGILQRSGFRGEWCEWLRFFFLSTCRS